MLSLSPSLAHFVSSIDLSWTWTAPPCHPCSLSVTITMWASIQTIWKSAEENVNPCTLLSTTGIWPLGVHWDKQLVELIFQSSIIKSLQQRAQQHDIIRRSQSNLSGWKCGILYGNSRLRSAPPRSTQICLVCCLFFLCPVTFKSCFTYDWSIFTALYCVWLLLMHQLFHLSQTQILFEFVFNAETEILHKNSGWKLIYRERENISAQLFIIRFLSVMQCSTSRSKLPQTQSTELVTLYTSYITRQHF